MTNQTNDGVANDIDSGHDSAAASRLKSAADAVRDAAAATKNAAADALSSAKEKVGDALDAAKEKSGAAYSTAKDRTADAYDAAREKAGEAYGTAREKASSARQATATGIDDNPVAALLGGIALGVLVGALLPRTRTEESALGPIAGKLAETAKAAALAARDAGKQTLDEMGVNSDNARDQVEKLVDTAVKAATSAGTAAADTVRH
jgi:ElaB/YqjD/DUF883 family membrane-anchored ribosome-binding protein